MRSKKTTASSQGISSGISDDPISAEKNKIARIGCRSGFDETILTSVGFMASQEKSFKSVSRRFFSFKKDIWPDLRDLILPLQRLFMRRLSKLIL